MPVVSAAVWMIIGSIAFAGMNVVIRQASTDMHTFQLVFFRNLFGLLWMAPWLLSYGAAALRTGRVGFYVFRSSLDLVGMYGSFYAVTHMAMADATALSFTAPLFATVGAVLFLKEKIRLRRTVATLVGFIGVLKEAFKLNPDLIYIVGDGSFQRGEQRGEFIEFDEINSTLRELQKSLPQPATVNFIGVGMRDDNRKEIRRIISAQGGSGRFKELDIKE